MRLSSYLPRNHIDALAMGFTFTMVPLSYLHGVINVAPVLWPTSEPGLSEETARGNTTTYYFMVTLMTFLFVNTFTNLILTLTVDTTCHRVSLPVVSQPGWYYCPYCQYYAPPRAHHCPTCSKCVLRRDHHCFFAGKCIGFYNHRYFIAFLIYLFISAGLGVVTSFMAISRLSGGISWTLLPAFIFPVLAWIFQVMPVNIIYMVECSLAIFITTSVGALLGLQLFQLYRGQTYHELQKSINFYGRGHSPRENLREVLGANWWFFWVFPFIPSPRDGDGSHYAPMEQQQGTGAVWRGGGVAVEREGDQDGSRRDGKRKSVKTY